LIFNAPLFCINPLYYLNLIINGPARTFVEPNFAFQLEPGTFTISMGTSINLLRKFNVPCRGDVITARPQAHIISVFVSISVNLIHLNFVCFFNIFFKTSFCYERSNFIPLNKPCFLNNTYLFIINLIQYNIPVFIPS